MEFLYLILCISLSIVGYFVYKFYIFREKQKICEEILADSSRQIATEHDYDPDRLRSIKQLHEKTSIFREMAIEEIAKQRLVYDEASGRYVRRRQIN